MGKQSTNQPTKPTKKQDRRRERREEQLRRAAAQRRTAVTRRIVIGGVIAAVILTVASFLYFARGQSGSAAAQPSPTAASTSVDTNGQPSLMPVVDNVQCNSTEMLTYHVHAHLSIYINGQAIPIAQNIGITNACFYWLHTHDTSGVIHIEAPQQMTFTLGNFLHVWKQQFPQLQYPSQLDQSAGWQVYVDGKPYKSDFNTITLDPHKLITLAYHSPGITPDTIFNWGSL